MVFCMVFHCFLFALFRFGFSSMCLLFLLLLQSPVLLGLLGLLGLTEMRQVGKGSSSKH